MVDLGKDLREHNDKIVKYIIELKDQKKDICEIIEKQQEEKCKIEKELERLTYKLALIKKSLSQRIKARGDYEKTITELEGNYAKLVETSNRLLITVQSEFSQLENSMDKKINTEIQAVPQTEEESISTHNILRQQELQTSVLTVLDEQQIPEKIPK